MEVNMRSSDQLVRHAVLLVAELLAVPASLAVTSIVSLGAVLALDLLRVVGVVLAIVSGVLGYAIGASIPVVRVWNDLVYGSVALAAFVALESLGAFAVTRYRRAFEALDEVRPTTVAAMPLLGLTPAGYVLATTGTVELPGWLFAFTALWAHALMYRVIAVDATFGGDSRVGVFVGCLAAIPALVAEVLFVAWHAGRRDVVRGVLAAATAVGIPSNRWVLVLLPLGVTAAYGLRWKPHLGRFRWRAILATLRRKLDRGTLHVRLPSQAQSSEPRREPSQRRQSPTEATPSEDWIPRSASAVSPAESPGVGEDDDSRLGGGDSTDDAGGERERSDETTHNDLLDDSETPDDEAITDDVAATCDEEATADDGAATSGVTANPDSEVDPEREGTVTKLYDHSSPVESASDTRIYTTDVESSGESGGDESSVTACPECAWNVPEDDDVRFCARCGAEL